ncbi:MAG: hypothetical protein MI861_04705 [Pirellulales bacterium]|nr:hypothetical protein [Pirellulales bacterium]
MKPLVPRPRSASAGVVGGMAVWAMILLGGLVSVSADPPQPSDPQALRLLQEVVRQITHGPAFDAKVRERVWATGREVVGVGTYEQAGGGGGQFNLQITMLDGGGKHRLQQISDGRLAWTRTEIAGKVTLRRVDVGRLNEWVRLSGREVDIAPGLKVGGWAEMLDTIQQDYVLTVDNAKLGSRAVWVITGQLRDEARARIQLLSNHDNFPELCPTKVRVVIAAKPNPETGFGQLLPIQFQFWSDPVAAPPQGDQPARRQGRLITLIEIYSIRPITPPSIERFRFENDNAEVNFTNETDRYIQRYGVQLTAGQRRQLRR